MQKLTRADLFSLEEYSEKRKDFRARVLEHKKNRKLMLGDHASLHFEDRLTMQYQIQEMLRVERIFEAEAIEEELETYNPLIPDGNNLKVTFLVEFEDAEERRRALAKLIGIEDKVWVQTAGFDRVWAIADEDMERENAEKTSSVHFLRFELMPDMIAALKEGGALAVGIEHENYNVRVDAVPEGLRASLAADFD